MNLLDEVRFRTNGSLGPFLRFGLQGLVAELQSVHEEVLAEVRRIAYRDFAREHLLEHSETEKLHRQTAQRLLSLATWLSVERKGVSISKLKRGDIAPPVAYRGKHPRTLARDIDFLMKSGLFKMEGDNLLANIDRMSCFTVRHYGNPPKATE